MAGPYINLKQRQHKLGQFQRGQETFQCGTIYFAVQRKLQRLFLVILCCYQRDQGGESGKEKDQIKVKYFTIKVENKFTNDT